MVEITNDDVDWQKQFRAVVGQIMSNMHERFRTMNLTYSYRKVLQNSLTRLGYTQEDIDDFILLETAEAYLLERTKHEKTLGV